MLNVTPSAPPFCRFDELARCTGDSDSVNAEALSLDAARWYFNAQCEDPDYLNSLDDMARNGYGFL